MDVGEAIARLATVRVQWLVLGTLCYAAILPLWALQWHLLSPRDPSRRRSRCHCSAHSGRIAA